MPKTNALNELLDSTQPMLDPAHTMPASTKCECQSCPEHDPDDTGKPCDAELASPTATYHDGAVGGYLVERAGYSCIDCLPMMVEIGLAMTVDSIEPDPTLNEPVYVRVANFESGTPTFSAG